jgi:signal transduction histidine kinase
MVNFNKVVSVMDVIWKKRMRIILWFVLFAFGVSGVLSAIVNDNDYWKGSYFKTSQFQDEVSQLTKYIHAFEISYQPKEERIKALTVTNGEIGEYRFQYGDLAQRIMQIENEYRSNIELAEANKDQKVAAIYRNERDKKLEELADIFNNDDYVKEKILNEKEIEVDRYYNELEGYRQEYQTYKDAFVYYLTNTTTGEVYTNLPSKSDKSVDQYINEKNTYYILSYPSQNFGFLRVNTDPISYNEVVNIAQTQSNDRFEGKIGVAKDAANSNLIMFHSNNYEKEKLIFWMYSVVGILALISSIILGKRLSIITLITEEKWQERYAKIPFDLAIILLVISVLVAFALADGASYFYYNFDLEDILFSVVVHTFVFGLTFVQCIYLYHLLGKRERLWERTALSKVVMIFQNAFLNRRVGTQIILVLMTIFVLGMVLGLSFAEADFLVLSIPAMIIVGIPLLIIIIKKIGYFNRILLNARAIAKGQFEPDLKIKGKSVLAKLAQDLNEMKHGVKTSQSAQAKSERLKTELITNVSHDLRTPLTSIITYTELLKDNQVSDDERSSYIEIIDRKSKRLKVLIDDLFEASKMASGNIELSKTKVDVVQLLHQSLAEHNESSQDSPIQFRITAPEHPLYAFVDGQKLWRVFENLIGNMRKYALENTRAYIHVKNESEQIILTFKNISKYELSENTDELFERFKRGDESRHTDGSGLGLAIAKSIMDLHDAKMDIEVDGDLFKVTVVLDKLN